MLAKFFSNSNLGSLNPNLALLFGRHFSIANFYVPGNPEIGNIAAVGKNQCQIRIQRPKIRKDLLVSSNAQIFVALCNRPI